MALSYYLSQVARGKRASFRCPLLNGEELKSGVRHSSTGDETLGTLPQTTELGHALSLSSTRALAPSPKTSFDQVLLCRLGLGCFLLVDLHLYFLWKAIRSRFKHGSNRQYGDGVSSLVSICHRMQPDITEPRRRHGRIDRLQGMPSKSKRSMPLVPSPTGRRNWLLLGWRALGRYGVPLGSV